VYPEFILRTSFHFSKTQRIFKSCIFSSEFFPFLETEILLRRASLGLHLENPMTSDLVPDTADSQPDIPDIPVRRPGRKAWETALLLAASAAFGGLAVAFWNRKTLADMRNRNPEPPRRTIGREDDIY
jgi:hypothetical protein